VHPVTVLVIGDVTCPFFNIPYDLKSRIARRLSVKEFHRLTATCKEFQKLWLDDALWKIFLKRDFGVEAVNEADRLDDSSRYKRTYKQRFVQQKERRLFSMVMPPVTPNPPPGVTDPNSYYYPPTAPHMPGIFGGPDDLNPLGCIPPSGGMMPRPPRFPGYHPAINPPLHPGGPHAPFGPRIRPVSPYDPDAGLFGPRQPGRGPRGPRPNNPFGGGGPFPGGGFF